MIIYCRWAILSPISPSSFWTPREKLSPEAEDRVPHTSHHMTKTTKLAAYVGARETVISGHYGHQGSTVTVRNTRLEFYTRT